MRVELSYEERIINALNAMKHPRGEHFMERDCRQFEVIRGILQPLYDELKAARAGQQGAGTQ